LNFAIMVVILALVFSTVMVAGRSTVVELSATGDWRTYIVDGADTYRYPSIALDGQNNVHICYSDKTTGLLKYATVNDGIWARQVVPGTGENVSYPSMALDSNGRNHICYSILYSNLNYLNYATDSSGTWSNTVIDQTAESGFEGSIAIDSANKVHVGYYDYADGDLKYATNANGSWAISTLDTAGDVGGDTSIAVDLSGKVHISYLDRTNGDLRYATNADGYWKLSTIDTQYCGWSSSIAIDSADAVHISYEGSPYDLKYATNAGGSWSIRTIDSTGNTGYYTSIAIDSNDRAHISYVSWTSGFGSGNLRYATELNGTWSTNTVDSVGDVGIDSSIALGSDDAAHVAYCDSGNGYLKYATNAATTSLSSSYNELRVTLKPDGTEHDYIKTTNPLIWKGGTFWNSDNAYNKEESVEGSYTILERDLNDIDLYINGTSMSLTCEGAGDERVWIYEGSFGQTVDLFVLKLPSSSVYFTSTTSPNQISGTGLTWYDVSDQTIRFTSETYNGIVDDYNASRVLVIASIAAISVSAILIAVTTVYFVRKRRLEAFNNNLKRTREMIDKAKTIGVDVTKETKELDQMLYEQRRR